MKMFPLEQFDISKLPYDDASPDNLDTLCFKFTSPPLQNTLKSPDFKLEDDEQNNPFASLGIVTDFPTTSSTFNGGKQLHVPICNNVEDSKTKRQNLSTPEKIRIAGQQFIDSYSLKADEVSELITHPFAVSFSGLSDDETKDIQLLLTLLSSAEKAGKKQFNRAKKLLQLCSDISLNEGNPVERLVYYFSEAIRMKINSEIGKVALNGLESMQFDLQEALMNVDTCIFAFHQKVPLSQVCQFSSFHTIIDNLYKSRKIHVIDLEIRTGMQYIVMMQSIASRSDCLIKHVKITAIGTRSESKINDTCKRLADVVMVADVLDFNIDLLELDGDEKVAVYAPFILSTLLVKPNRLEYLMREIRKINPCITVITEVEANHTSPVFVDRFIDALFFYGALFDSMSDCLSNDDLNRKALESVFYGHCIRNIVAAEGDERTIRHIGVNVWRKFFQRFEMLEIKLSDATLNEANLLIDNFKCGDSCSLLVDGGCFIVGWKSVPIFTVSAWKNRQQLELLYFNPNVHHCIAVTLVMNPSKKIDLCKPADDDRSSKLQEIEKHVQKPSLGDSGDLNSFDDDFDSSPMIKGTHLQSNNDEKGSSFVSDGILEDFSSKSRNADGSENILVPSCKTDANETNDQKLSTNERIRLAGELFIEANSSKHDEIFGTNNLILSRLSDEEGKDIKLLLTLLDLADKIVQRQFNHAIKLIESCINTSSAEGNPIERLVYYFFKAIREKIKCEMESKADDELEKIKMFDLQEVLMSVDTTSIILFHQRLPLSRICHFSSVHMMIENVKNARKIHVIDLEIRTGMKYIVMLQALASRYERDLEHFKITAIGKRLADFAKSMNISFSFKIVMVADVLDFNIDLLELNEEEKVVVYAPVFLSTLIVKPNDLEYLMCVIRKINPCITVVAEIEANLTSPAFSHRFIEALFFYGALFDSMSYCLTDEDSSRRVLESVFLGQTIRNIVAAEGDERTMRHVGVDVWRLYFARFGMEEIVLSAESLFEAKLFIDKFDCESGSSIRDYSGCLVVDWKDVPIYSVSAWKFV
ncbi:hypothetical protein LXL04_005388 [Taraxacum kok-saghyz]